MDLHVSRGGVLTLEAVIEAQADERQTGGFTDNLSSPKGLMLMLVMPP